MKESAEPRSGLASNERRLLCRLGLSLTPNFEPLAQWANRLRQLLFPDRKPWHEREDCELYTQKDSAVMQRHRAVETRCIAAAVARFARSSDHTAARNESRCIGGEGRGASNTPRSLNCSSGLALRLMMFPTLLVSSFYRQQFSTSLLDRSHALGPHS